MSEHSGPPVRLLTHRERVQRRRVIAALVLAGGAFAIALTVGALRVATQPNADVHLGSETFRVGSAKSLERRIRADKYPLLFQDLRNKSIDVFVDHQRGKPFYEGWRAVEAHGPGAPRTCTLDWNGHGFTDPCDATIYPADGAGLRRFQVKVIKGVLYVNFRKII